MRECRFYPWCSYIEDHGCTKDSCRHHQPMPDVGALLRIAQVLESADKSECMGCVLEDSGCHLCVIGVEHEIARRIRQAIGG